MMSFHVDWQIFSERYILKQPTRCVSGSHVREPQQLGGGHRGSVLSDQDFLETAQLARPHRLVWVRHQGENYGRFALGQQHPCNVFKSNKW